MVAFLFLFQPHLSLAQNQNVGFVETNIWYSKDPFTEGDKIKIYTLVFNPSSNNFKGTVSFFDKTTLLGKKDFAIPALSAEVVSIDWSVSVGGHQIFARIDEPRFEISAGKYEQVSISNTETEKSERTVAKKLPDIKEVKDKINNTLDSSIKPIEELKDKINESLPPEVSKPVNNAFSYFEETRLSASDAVWEKRTEVKQEIDKIQEPDEPEPKVDQTDKDSKQESSNAETKTEQKINPQTPLKYVWLFLLTILGYILKYKILFYLVAIILIFLILRLVFRLFKK